MCVVRILLIRSFQSLRYLDGFDFKAAHTGGQKFLLQPPNSSREACQVACQEVLACTAVVFDKCDSTCWGMNSTIISSVNADECRQSVFFANTTDSIEITSTSTTEATIAETTLAGTDPVTFPVFPFLVNLNTARSRTDVSAEPKVRARFCSKNVNVKALT